jgi:hypothetical protein
MRQMIQDVPLGFNLFRKSKIIAAQNPFRSVSIRLLLYKNKYFWIAMLDFESPSRYDTYFVGKEQDVAKELFRSEVELWGN